MEWKEGKKEAGRGTRPEEPPAAANIGERERGGKARQAGRQEGSRQSDYTH